MDKGKLFGVGVGPGDPELMTLKAARVIREADIIALPDGGSGRSVVVDITADLTEEKKIVRCRVPMTRDQATLRVAHEKTADLLCSLLDEGHTIAYLCLGDVTTYSSFMPVHDVVLGRGYDVELVPGVTSYCAAAARLGVALCQEEERLVVAPATDVHLDEVLGFSGTKVLLKPSRDSAHIRELLAEHDLLDSTSAVTLCGMPGERVIPSLADAGPQDNLGYLTTLICHG